MACFIEVLLKNSLKNETFSVCSVCFYVTIDARFFLANLLFSVNDTKGIAMMNQVLSVPNWNDRDWCSSKMHSLGQVLADWLLEQGSMTHRCEQHCYEVTVQPQFEGFVSAEKLGKELSELPKDRRYWIREIFLFGDNIPWIWARTVVPEKTLNDSKQGLTELGATPLGRYLFSQSELERDYIQVSLRDDLWGRRSRLRLSGNPLLLTEIFLPAAPLY